MNMSFFVYRNHTIEHLFSNFKASYSGYGDIATAPDQNDTLVWFYELSYSLSSKGRLDELMDIRKKVEMLFGQGVNGRQVLLFIPSAGYCNKEILVNHNTEVLLLELSKYMYSLSEKYPNIKVLDLSDFTKNYSLNELLDWKFYYLSDMILNPKLTRDFQQWLTRNLDVIKGIRKKCLVLDCDNTLWGGVVGEDGIDGIKIGNIYPGSSFRDFQLALVEAAKQGVILTLCSKNNEEDVLEVFDKHPDMILRREHIAAFRINWQNKARNIQELASELSIGEDSMVFIDDNPVERLLVKETLPHLSVGDFPAKEYNLLAFFKKLYTEHFLIYSLTNEDKAKTQQYIENAKRSQLKNASLNVDDYLASLDISLDFQLVNEFNLTRIAQMTQKTNQFNLTTRRYTEVDLQKFIAQDAIISCLGVEDRFGDNGITVASILKIYAEHAVIDSFLLSCRILGRGIEIAYLRYLLNMLFERGVKIVFASYIPSTKNRQTESFYDSLGFELIKTRADGTKDYKLSLSAKFEIKSYYNFTEK